MKKALFIISALALTLVACGETTSSSSSSFSSVSIPTDPEEVKQKIYETLYGVGEGNFTLSYTHDGVDYSDVYTTDYIYYDYWHDAVGLINPDNKGTYLYYLGVNYDDEVEVFSPCGGESGLLRSTFEYTGLDYFTMESTNLINVWDPSDIVLNDFGYCVTDFEVVVALSGLMTQDDSVAGLNAVIFNLNEDGSVTFQTALFSDQSLTTLVNKYEPATISKIGKSKHKVVEDFVFNFTPYSEVLPESALSDFLVDTYTFTSSVKNAIKYQNNGDKIMDIVCTNNGSAAELYSYNYNTTVENSAYYENQDGEIYQQYVDGTNTLQIVELGYSWEEFFPSASNEFSNLRSSFYKIKENVYRSFSPDAYRLLLTVTCSSDLGTPLYTDAIIEDGKVTSFIFGFMEYYSGKNSDGNLIHMVVETTISTPQEIIPPTICEVDTDTPNMETALNYLRNNNYHASITSSISEEYIREIFVQDGYYLDLSVVEGDFIGLGYYDDGNNNVTYFLISKNSEGSYSLSESTLTSKEYYMSFYAAPEIFKKLDNGAYSVKNNVSRVQDVLLTSHFCVYSSLKPSTLQMNLDSNNLLSSYSYDFSGRMYKGTDQVTIEYSNFSFDENLKISIDAYVAEQTTTS